ncbi:MAG: ferredoxin [Rhodanobacteraceae bacterium]
MTMLPPPSPKKLGLVIDLDTCVGCHACAVACKEWNEGGQFGPLPDEDAYGAEPLGVWFNRIHSFEVQPPGNAVGDGPLQELAKTGFAANAPAMTVHFPRSCLHCETPDCVTVCPTGASYKRAEDGIVLVDEAKCIGCKLCSWACPYGAREYSEKRGVMQKCTLCVDRIYNESFAESERQPACVMACPTRARHFGDLGDAASPVSRLVAERGGVALMPELGYAPVNRYLPPRPRRAGCGETPARDAADESLDPAGLSPLLRWVDKLLTR